MHILLINLFFGGVSALIAHQKARNAVGWFAVGCLLGPFALIVAILPMALRQGVSRKCPQCSETVRAEARVCRYCHSNLREAISS